MSSMEEPIRSWHQARYSNGMFLGEEAGERSCLRVVANWPANPEQTLASSKCSWKRAVDHSEVALDEQVSKEE